VLRTVRLVDRLAQEVADRRAGGTGARPALLLLVDGVEEVCTLLDEADPARGSAQFLRLLRDGAAVGLTCVLTADRAVPGGRLAALAQQRLVLPLPDRADYAVAGVPARAVPGQRPPGRALLGEDALECQLAFPRPLAPRTLPGQPAHPPLRIPELPSAPVFEIGPEQHCAVPAEGGLLLPVGPGGDDGAPLVVDLIRTGGLLVSGPPGSGRTTALDAFARHFAAAGSPVLRVGGPTLESEGRDIAWLDPLDEAGVTAWLDELGGRPGVVLADDLGGPTECPALGRLPALGGRSGIALIAAAAPTQLSGYYTGPIAALRRGRAGLLLCPGPGDADLLGIRLPRTPLPVRPGSGWLVTGPSVHRVQVARRRILAAEPVPA
jgi:S-DNA-T family DNA segregation ATPase FtsK/SpoIIIE